VKTVSLSRASSRRKFYLKIQKIEQDGADAVREVMGDVSQFLQKKSSLSFYFSLFRLLMFNVSCADAITRCNRFNQRIFYGPNLIFHPTKTIVLSSLKCLVWFKVKSMKPVTVEYASGPGLY